jgi:conjugal transfer pilus assembly protein TraE
MHVILRNAHPSFFGELKKKLLAEGEMLKKQNASYVFFPIELSVNAHKLEVTLLGDRVFYVAGQQISSEREMYKLTFVFNGSKLLLNGISALEKNSNG